MVNIDEYTIVTISDDRLAFKEEIDLRAGYDKASDIDFVDGNNADIAALKRKFGIKEVWPWARYGELGVWFSMLNVCKYAYENNKVVLAFEDDAIIYVDNLKERLSYALTELPDNTDVFSLVVPENQRDNGYIEWLDKPAGLGIRYGSVAPSYQVGNCHAICRAYQGYCLVAMVYTPKGAKEILDLVKDTGLTTPADCWIFEMNDSNDLMVYTLTPEHPVIVGINWDNQEKTTVHNTERLINANL